jgi:hypothetical protein
LIPWITGILVVAVLGCTFLFLKKVHPLGAFALDLGRDRMEGIGIRFKGATLVGRSDGKKVWQINAKSIDISKDRRFATFTGLTHGLLLRDDKKVASLSADRVVYNILSRDVSTPGTAEMKIVNGPSFKVHKVYWSGRKSRLFCEGGVDAVIGASTMHGDRLTADLERKEIVATKVKGQIRLPD